MDRTLQLAPTLAPRRRGRKPVASDPKQRARHIECAREMLDARRPVKQIARLLGISPATAYRWRDLAYTYPEAQTDLPGCPN